jgi:hypothetical protein
MAKQSEKGIRIEDGENFKSSPYVIDLRKVIVERQNSVVEKKTKKDVLGLLSELTLFSFFYFSFAFLRKILKFIWKHLKNFIEVFIVRLKLLLKVFARFFASTVFRINSAVLKLRYFFSRSKFLEISPPRGWHRAIVNFLIFSFLLVLPLQTLSYYNRFENFLIQNNLGEINFNFLNFFKFFSKKANVEKVLAISHIWDKILGYDSKKRYLLIFENSNEMRPTGGFIGSFGLVDIKDGKIQAIDIPPEGSYALQGWLRENVISPEPMHLINARWEFQDANWFPDFPTSAKKIMWFYSKSGGPSVDGVIAITSNFFEDLLKIIGPIELPEYSKIINSENFAFEIQKAVELEYNKEINKPKQIIVDLIPKIIEKFSEKNYNFGEIVSLVNNALASKDLLLYFKDQDIENEILKLGWGGEIKDVEEEIDYLMVVDTNIGGGKTDAAIDKEIRHLTEIKEDGSIIDHVTITRIHKGTEGELFIGARNIDYLRIYVPKGSFLLNAEGFAKPDTPFEVPDEFLKPDKDLKEIEGNVIIDPESGTRINEEFGKTVFGNWVQVDPGKMKSVSFTYKLPYRITFDSSRNWFDNLKEKLGFLEEKNALYKFFVQKQAGDRKTTFIKEIKFPNNWGLEWQYPKNSEIQNSVWQVKNNLAEDSFYGLIFKK